MATNNKNPVRVMTVFGTRPEAIKMAPLVKALDAEPKVEAISCSTGQHRDMLDQVLDIFEITPDHDLAVMRPAQSLFDVTTNVLMGMEKLLKETKPDLVLVHGDTTSAFAGALAAFYLNIPVGHVEAGLRTGDMQHPFPEEMNRTFIDSISQMMFAPTQGSKDLLLKENLSADKIFITGNTVIDALQDTVQRTENDPTLNAAFSKEFEFLDPNKKLILVTGHRRENFGQGIQNLCDSLVELSKIDDVEILFPVHLNTNVKGPVHDALSNHDNIHLIEPVDYVGFVYLMNRSYLVITDSGGIQEEAPSLGKPVLVTREQTERPEAVTSGVAKLVGSDPSVIVGTASKLIHDPEFYQSMSLAQNPYGDGLASKRIVEHILNDFTY